MKNDVPERHWYILCLAMPERGEGGVGGERGGQGSLALRANLGSDFNRP